MVCDVSCMGMDSRSRTAVTEVSEDIGVKAVAMLCVFSDMHQIMDYLFQGSRAVFNTLDFHQALMTEFGAKWL